MAGRFRPALLAGLAVCGAIVTACGSSKSSGGSAPPAAPPAAPTGLAATAANQAVHLAWTASTGATSYKVYQGSTSGALSTKTAISTVTSGVTFNDTGLTNGTAYYYQVTAVGTGGESGGSNEATATPQGTLAPPAPTGVTATAASGQVTVSWGAVTGATSYDIYWSTTSPVTKGSNVIANATSPYVHTGRTDGTTYYYAVTALNGTLESGLSAEVSATPSAPPPYIEATVIRWTPPPPTGVPIIQIQVYTDSSRATPIGNATVKVNSAVVPWSAANGQYESSTMIAAGANVALDVTIPSGLGVAPGTYSASGKMYTAAPTVTSPASGATWSRTASHNVTWTAGAPTSNAWTSVNVVGIQDGAGTFYPVNTNNSPFEVPVGDTSYTLAANTLPSNGTYSVFVGIGTSGIVGNTGGGIAVTGAATGSGLYLGYVSAVVTITAN